MDYSPRPLEQAINTQIRMELARRDWDQATLAEKVGVTRAALNRYLKGHRPMPMATFMATADAFGMSPQKLMRLAEENIEQV